MPTVSVIIPTYNRARYICDAIDSALCQTYRDLEVIVVDDGSTDGTRTVLQKYGDLIRYFHRDNGGHSAARNMGLAHASGEYIAFLDSDDVFLPTKLEVQLRGFDQCPNAGMIYSRSLCFDSTLQASDAPPDDIGGITVEMQDIFEDMLLLRKGPIPDEILVRRACFAEVGSFDEHLRVAADHDMCLRIAAHCDVAFVDAVVAGYRQHSGQLSRAGRRQGRYITALDYILEKIAADLPPTRQTAHVYQLLRRAKALVDVQRGCYVFLNKSRREGGEYLRQTLHEGQLLREDADWVAHAIRAQGEVADEGDPFCVRSTELLRAVWNSLPRQYRYLRKHLRVHLASLHRRRAHHSWVSGSRLKALLEAMSWLRYRDPSTAPNVVKRLLAPTQADSQPNHASR